MAYIFICLTDCDSEVENERNIIWNLEKKKENTLIINSRRKFSPLLNRAALCSRFFLF